MYMKSITVYADTFIKFVKITPYGKLRADYCYILTVTAFIIKSGDITASCP